MPLGRLIFRGLYGFFITPQMCPSRCHKSKTNAFGPRWALDWILIFSLGLGLLGCESSKTTPKASSAAQAAGKQIAVSPAATPTSAVAEQKAAPAPAPAAVLGQSPPSRLVAVSPAGPAAAPQVSPTPVAVVTAAVSTPATAPAAKAVTPTATPPILAKKIEKAPTAVFAPPLEQPQGSDRPLIILSLAAATGLGLFLCYQASEAAKLRRRLRAIMADFHGTVEAQQKVLATSQATAKDAARAYLSEILQKRLASVSIDEVKTVVSGARLQPLKEHGITNLLQCQGWNAARLISLRGIGPDSAAKIEVAINTLTKRVGAQEIPHPRLSDGRAGSLKVYRELYAFFEVQTLLGDHPGALEAETKKLQKSVDDVLGQTAFFAWLFGLIGGAALKSAIQSGRALEAQAKSGESLGVPLAAGKERIAAVGKFLKGSVDAGTMTNHVETNREYYATSLAGMLGPDMESQQPPPILTSPSRYRETSAEAASEPVRVRDGAPSVTGFTIKVDLDQPEPPAPPKRDPRVNDHWLPSGKAATVGSFQITGGLVYVGQGLQSIRGDTVEPALINQKLPVATDEADCTTRMLNYWSSYSFATPGARASYLQWLSTGRNNPSADIGYVFLYFYGLERRVLSDAHHEESARAEVPAIIAEVRRLREIYSRNGSFDRYSSQFLDYVEFTQQVANDSESDEAPALKQYHLSFSLRRKLGRLAVSGLPLPADWAYAWYHNDPRTRLPAAAFRCPDKTARLFKLEYSNRFEAGLILPASKTRLKLAYKTASSSFGVMLTRSLDLPDVGLLTTSYGKLDSVAVECFKQLDGYSRFLGRKKTEAMSLEAQMLLPPALWPEAKRRALEELKTQATETKVMKFNELLEAFGQDDEPSRSTYLSFCRVLNAAGIGLEPDPRFGTDVPYSDEPVVIFRTGSADEPGEGFGLASLLLRLSSTLAAADGDFSEPEAERIKKHIESDQRLSRAEKVRLVARLALFRAKAPLLTGLKPTIAALSPEARQQITDFLLSLVYADRDVQPGEVKVMEKIYTMFGLDPGTLYTRLHELSAGPTPTRTETRKTEGPIHLDAAKVKRLRAASEEVTKRLNVIFAEPEPEETPPKEPEVSEEGTNPESKVLDLDQEHNDLVVVLIGRMEWTRSEFEELCSDKGLMPDGAIERINEAAFQKFDQAIIEGDDPLEIAVKLVEEAIYGTNNSSQGS